MAELPAKTPSGIDFRVLALGDRTDEECEAAANALGAEGWDLAWIDPQGRWGFRRPHGRRPLAEAEPTGYRAAPGAGGGAHRGG